MVKVILVFCQSVSKYELRDWAGPWAVLLPLRGVCSCKLRNYMFVRSKQLAFLNPLITATFEL
jgi:hypothetical protein